MTSKKELTYEIRFKQALKIIQEADIMLADIQNMWRRYRL